MTKNFIGQIDFPMFHAHHWSSTIEKCVSTRAQICNTDQVQIKQKYFVQNFYHFSSVKFEISNRTDVFTHFKSVNHLKNIVCALRTMNKQDHNLWLKRTWITKEMQITTNSINLIIIISTECLTHAHVKIVSQSISNKCWKAFRHFSIDTYIFV